MISYVHSLLKCEVYIWCFKLLLSYRTMSLEKNKGREINSFFSTHGGNSLSGRRSSNISPSFGGGIRFSGDQTLVGVFHGTTGGDVSLLAVVDDAKRKCGIIDALGRGLHGRPRQRSLR